MAKLWQEGEKGGSIIPQKSILVRFCPSNFNLVGKVIYIYLLSKNYRRGFNAPDERKNGENGELAPNLRPGAQG